MAAGKRGDLVVAAPPDETPEHRLALNDPGVLRGVDGRRGVVPLAGREADSADLEEFARLLERLSDRYNVGRGWVRQGEWSHLSADTLPL